MNGKQMLKYHLLVPAAIFAVLLLVGVPLGSALGIGLVTGCGSMMFMMMQGMSGRGAGPSEPEHRGAEHREPR